MRATISFIALFVTAACGSPTVPPSTGDASPGRDANPGPADAMPVGADALPGADGSPLGDAASDAGPAADARADAEAPDGGPMRECFGHPTVARTELAVRPDLEMPPWTHESTYGAQASFTDNGDGTFTLRDPDNAPSTYAMFYRSVCPPIAGDTSVIEWRSRTVSATGPIGDSAVIIRAARRVGGVTVGLDFVAFYDTSSIMQIGERAAITPGFHDFRWEREYRADLESGENRLYVDGALVLTQTSTAFDRIADETSAVYFAARGFQSSSESVWDYVRYRLE